MPAVETLAQRIASSEGLTVETNIAPALMDSERLAPDVESTIYRMVQEALTNVAKHAAATRLEIALLMKDDAVSIEVRDDGRGFDPAHPANGFGLVGIRERVLLVDGEVTITSAEGRGTVIRALIPVRTSEADIPLSEAG